MPGVYLRTRRAGHGGRYEPRFKPPRETLASGETLVHNCLALGGYDTFEEAQIVHQIAAFYYGKAGPHLDLGNGLHYDIDSSWNEDLDFRRGKEKEQWVASKAKEVFRDFQKAKASSGLLNAASSNQASVIPSVQQVASARGSSHSGFSSPATNKSPENLAPSSSATLLVASNPEEQWFSEDVSDGGIEAVSKELGGDVEYFPVSSASPLIQGFISPTCSSLGLLENTELLGTTLENFTQEQMFEKDDAWWNDCARSPPHSVFIPNNHPQCSHCSAVNAAAAEQRALLIEPDGPCSPVVEVATLREKQGSNVEVAIPHKVSLDITSAPVKGALRDSQGIQNSQCGMDVGAPVLDPSFGSDLSKEDYLFQLLRVYQKECGDLKRENSKLRREVKRLKAISPMAFGT